MALLNTSGVTVILEVAMLIPDVAENINFFHRKLKYSSDKNEVHLWLL
jgi:hypothetical protein